MPKEYIAPQGAVWDWISFQHYGDERFIAALLGANPSARHVVQFEEPALIIIPDRPAVPENSVTQLPPWKQGA